MQIRPITMDYGDVNSNNLLDYLFGFCLKIFYMVNEKERKKKNPWNC